MVLQTEEPGWSEFFSPTQNRLVPGTIWTLIPHQQKEALADSMGSCLRRSHSGLTASSPSHQVRYFYQSKPGAKDSVYPER